jgi:succinyl-diaminopimelate desuccinylase
LSAPLPIDREAAVRLLADFVGIPTLNPPGQEKPGAEFLARELERRGFAAQLTEISPGRANVTARLRGSGDAPALLFNGHIDVVPPGEVPWKHPPFGAQVEDGRLYGRGSADMKGGLAAMLVAMEALAASGRRLKGDVIFSAVADEETSATGSIRLVSDGLLKGVGAVVIGEPTGFHVYIAQKGTFWLEVETLGVTAHGSMPHLGRNAIMDMQAVLEEMANIDMPEGPDPLLGRATLNVGMIHGGVGPNVVPDSCRASLDIRLPAGVSQTGMMQELEAAVARAGTRRPGLTARIRNTGSRVAVATTAGERIVQLGIALCKEQLGLSLQPQSTPGFATDASVLCSDPPIPYVIIGPGREELAHKPDEYLLIDDYMKAIVLYATIAERYLGFA